MKLKNYLLILLLLSMNTSANVCSSIKNIPGFSSSPLFDKAIINGKPLDYYFFVSVCDFRCLVEQLKKENINHTIGSNLSVFDKDSIATITLEKQDLSHIMGYLVCSTTNKRKYITIPFQYPNLKVTLDLQTEDHLNITRILNFQSVNRSNYLNLLKQIESLSIAKIKVIGFYQYKLAPKLGSIHIKVSDINTRGDFMVIMEKSRI